MNTYEKKLKQKILTLSQQNLRAITPGLVMQVHHKGRKKADLALGATYKYYDLASLTKIIFTVSALMQLHDEKLLRGTDRIANILAWWPHEKTMLKQVLSHSAGLPWWAPFYKELDLKTSPEMRREQLRRLIAKTTLVGSGLKSAGGRAIKSVYSDIDFILLGYVLEELRSAPLIEIWQSLPWREKTPGLHFNINNKPTFARDKYAPTEKCPWRKKILRGEVHDDNTWSFGGVSSHAGLFGTIDDVAQYGLLLRQAFRGDTLAKSKSNFASHSTVKKFSHRAITRKQGDWAMGFILPTKGSASCGKYFHSTSFGHTGFTGTSLWYDPKEDLLVTILSNRVHPTRENSKYVQFRPQIHDAVVESL